MTTAESLRTLTIAARDLARLLDDAAHALLVGERGECARLLERAKALLPGIEQIAESGGWQNELDALASARQEWELGEQDDDEVRRYDALENMSDVCLTVANGLAGIAAEHQE